MPAQSQNEDDRRWDVLRWAIVVAVALSHVAFVLLDQRLPADVGRQAPAVPWLLDQMRTPRGWPAVVAHLGQMSGWYEVVQALGARALGAELRLLGAGWLVVLLASAGAIARRLGGPARAAAATGLLATNTMLLLQVRIGSLHVAEAALLLAILACWTGDRDLERGGTRIAVGVLGALVASLRATGLLWLAPLAVLLAAASPRRRVAPVLAGWALGAIPSLVALGPYAAGKLARRDLYAAVVPPLGSELLAWGPLFLGLAGVGLALARRFGRIEALLAAWVGLGLALKLVFHTGLVDFLAMIAPVALLASAGLARWRPLAAAPVPAVLLVLAPTFAGGAGVLDFAQPYDRLRVEDVRAVIDATCPPSGCVVAVDQGLFHPYAEDEGLEIVLLDRPGVGFVMLRNVRTKVGALRVDALVAIVCDDGHEADWRRRWPESDAVRGELQRRHALEPVWERDVGSGCTWRWSTPHGEVRAPERLPSAPR